MTLNSKATDSTHYQLLISMCIFAAGFLPAPAAMEGRTEYIAAGRQVGPIDLPRAISGVAKQAFPWVFLWETARGARNGNARRRGRYARDGRGRCDRNGNGFRAGNALL